MDTFIYFVGLCVVCASALIVVAGLMLFAVNRLGMAQRNAIAMIDLDWAISDWKKNHPEEAKRYSDEA